MRFLHSSDWHLGAAENEQNLQEDQRFFLDQICDIITQERIDAVLLAGDVFDRSVASAAAVRLYDYAMSRICMELKVPVLSIAGNHDSAERLASCGELLEQAGLHVLGAAQREPKVVPFADCEVFLLPWITEEKVKSLYPERREEIQSLTDAYRVMTDAMRQVFTPGKRHIALSHSYIQDAQTSESDRAAVIGTAAQVSAAVFEEFDYVALGHIHKPQDITENIRYSGTPMPFSFGKEETQEKSVTILDTETMERKIIPLKLLHRWTTLTGTAEELLNPVCSDEVRTGYVCLKVTDVALGLELQSRLREVYPNALVLAGKTYEGEDVTINLTVEQLEEFRDDPLEVFKSFFRDETKEEPNEHFLQMFAEAVQKYQEESV